MSIFVRLIFLTLTIASSLNSRMKLKMATNKIVSTMSIDKSSINNNIDNPTNKRIFAGGNFKKLVLRSSIFVDKSLFIKEIIESGELVTLITSPRRWGKSLNLDMLRRFLSIDINESTGRIIPKNETDDYKLFAGGEVTLETHTKKNLSKLNIAEYEEIMTHYLGKFPVIYLDFMGCRGDSFTEIKKKVLRVILTAFESFSTLRLSNKLFQGEPIKQQYKEVLAGLENGKDFKNSLKMISMLLYAEFDQYAWILIDEYDNVMNQAYIKLDIEEATKVVHLFRDILAPALKGNDYLYKGVMTGIQSIELPGLNNLGKYSIQDYKYSQYYGVNQNEMALLWAHFNVSDNRRNKMKDFYSGYPEKIAGTNEYIEKYNIWSVIKYLNYQDGGLKSYWEDNASYDFIKPLLRQDKVRDMINTLVDGGSIYLDLKMNFSPRDFKVRKELMKIEDNYVINDYSLDILFSFLFITGYLTETSNKKFKFPNQEIKNSMRNYLISYYSGVYSFDNDEIRDLIDILQKLFDKTQSTIMNDNEKIEFIKRLFISKFLPKFNSLMNECTLCNDENAIGGIFANEASVHSVLNYIGFQIADTLFETDIYMTKISNDEDDNSYDFNEQTTKGRLGMLLKNNNTGLIIEVKYRGSDAPEALKQAKRYEKLINDQETKIFIGLDVSENKTVTIAGEIYINNKCHSFNSSI